MGVHASKTGNSRGSTKRPSHSEDFERASESVASTVGIEPPTPSPRVGNANLYYPQAGEGGRSGNIARHSRSSSSRMNARDTGRFVRGDSDAEDILSSTVLMDHSTGLSPKGPTPNVGLPNSSSSTSIVAGNSGALGNRGLSRRTSSSSSLGSLQTNLGNSSVASHSRVMSDIEIGNRTYSPSPRQHGTRIAHMSHDHDTDADAPTTGSPKGPHHRSVFGFRSRANEQGSFSGIGNAPPRGLNDRGSFGGQATNHPGVSSGNNSARGSSNVNAHGGRSNSLSVTRVRSDSESSIPPIGVHRRSSFGSVNRLSRNSPPPRSNTPDAARRECKDADPGTPIRPSLHPSNDVSSSGGRSPPRRNSQVASLSQRLRFRSRSRSRSRGVSPSVAHPREYSNNRMQLPNEVVFHICGFMGPRSLGRLASTCRMLAQEDLLWRSTAILTYGPSHSSLFASFFFFRFFLPCQFVYGIVASVVYGRQSQE